MKSTLLLCPICGHNLEKMISEKKYACDANHSFDLAKQGYVNLIPVNEKSSKFPGDSKEMVLARREFLNKGFYQPVSEALNQEIIGAYPTLPQRLKKHDDGPNPTLNLLDLGCGEGYYTGRLFKALQDHPQHANLYGLDISKDAVKSAAGAVKGITWMVGNNYHLPLEDNSLDGVFSVFSPIKAEECARILKKGGLFFRVLPDVQHLIEMRELIYKKVILNEDVRYDADEGGLVYKYCRDVVYKIHLNQEELLALVKMTPHYWHTSKEDKAVLNQVENLDVTVAMKIWVYEKA